MVYCGLAGAIKSTLTHAWTSIIVVSYYPDILGRPMTVYCRWEDETARERTLYTTSCGQPSPSPSHAPCANCQGEGVGFYNIVKRFLAKAWNPIHSILLYRSAGLRIDVYG